MPSVCTSTQKSPLLHWYGCRNGKSCRLRWCNQLAPGVNKEPFTEEEVGCSEAGVLVEFPFIAASSLQQSTMVFCSQHVNTCHCGVLSSLMCPAEAHHH